jgi:hypothetical protein
MIDVLVATAGMLAVGWLVWRLLDRQERREDDGDPET